MPEPDLIWATLFQWQPRCKKNLRELEVRLRHLLQYVSTHPHLGLHFPYHTSNHFLGGIFTDVLFALSGAHSHQGLHFPQSGSSAAPFALEQYPAELVSQFSAEAEFITLMSGNKATKNFQHLLTESVADLTPILWCDHQAVFAMLENHPGEPGTSASEARPRGKQKRCADIASGEGNSTHSLVCHCTLFEGQMSFDSLKLLQ